jgi:hypothetical protein
MPVDQFPLVWSPEVRSSSYQSIPVRFGYMTSHQTWDTSRLSETLSVISRVSPVVGISSAGSNRTEGGSMSSFMMKFAGNLPSDDV